MGNFERVQKLILGGDGSERPQWFVLSEFLTMFVWLQGLKPEEIEEQQAKYEMVFKNIEELDRQGVQILSAKEIERLRKRFKDVHTKFTQYQRPSGGGKFSISRQLAL